MAETLSCFNCVAKSMTCFKSLDPGSLKFLNDQKTTFNYKGGQTIFREGGKPTGFYCLKSGKVKIFKIGVDGKEQIIRFVAPGDLFGVRALVGGVEYSAYSETLEESTICLIDKPTFVKLIDENLVFAHCIMKILSRLLEDAENKLTSLAQKPVRERLAETLVLMNNLFRSDTSSSQNRTYISLSRSDLANIVGTATETVIRLLSEFKDESYIEINGRNISLLDIDGLKRIGKVMN